MGLNYPFSGVNNVAEYMVSGVPWTTSSVLTSGITEIDLPQISRSITVKNAGSSNIKLGFDSTGILSNNFYIITPSNTFTAEFRIKSMFISSSGGNLVNITAGLTTINSTKNTPPSYTYTLTPTFSPAPGFIAMPLNVTLGSDVPNAIVYYTTDGTTPTLLSSNVVANGTVLLTNTTTINAALVVDGKFVGPVVTATYQKFITIDFTSMFSAGGGVDAASFTSKSGLSLSRASAATVQIGTSLISSNIGTNTARIGRKLDANPLALVLEETRTNILSSSRDINAALGGMNLASQSLNIAAGPDGNVLADLVSGTNSASSFSHFWNQAQIGVLQNKPYSVGEWLKSNNAALITQSMNPAFPTVLVQNKGVTTDWNRFTFSQTFNAAQGIFTPLQGQVGTPFNAFIDFMQFELGAFPTEAIITTGSPDSRAGERLFHPTGSTLVDNGRLGLAFRISPKGHSTQYTSNIRLWSTGTNNFFEINSTNRFVTASVGGTAITFTPAISWFADDVLDIWTAVGNGRPEFKYRNNVTGSIITLTASAGVHGPLVVADSLDLFCSGTVNQFTSYIRTITAYTSGTSLF
jgi:hypothetical protein